MIKEGKESRRKRKGKDEQLREEKERAGKKKEGKERQKYRKKDWKEKEREGKEKVWGGKDSLAFCILQSGLSLTETARSGSGQGATCPYSRNWH